jgi:rubrerythrin
MKTQNKQIISILYAFEQTEVLKALDLYTQGIKNSFEKTKQELKNDGWYPQKEKPANREFYFFENQYWVQSQQMRDKQIKERIDAMNRNKKENTKKYTGQKMDLSKVKIKCPECSGSMYKQSVCGGCAEGKQGYKIRLICEENPDHEFLL